MKVRDLISLLLDCPMDGDVEIEISTAWIEWLKMECKEAKDFESWRL